MDYDAQAKLFHGQIIGLKDVITFQGTSVKELEKAFKDSINDYLVWCQERGEKPEKAFSDNVRLRLPSHLHAELVRKGARQGVSLNQLITTKLAQ